MKRPPDTICQQNLGLHMQVGKDTTQLRKTLVKLACTMLTTCPHGAPDKAQLFWTDTSQANSIAQPKVEANTLNE